MKFAKSSSQIVYSRPNSLNQRAPENSLPRTQGVHYIFPFSPQTKRESRQIDFNDQAAIVQNDNENTEAPSNDSDNKEEEYDDYEGWDYEVSVDKTVAEEFSVSKSISDMVTSTLDYITSTFAPPSTLLTRTTTESTTSETTASTTTTTASTSVQVEENESSVKIKAFKPQNSTGNSAATFKHSFAKNVTAFKSPNLNSNSVRIHPFLASRKLKAQNEKVESLKAPSFNLNRNNFFKPRPAK